MKRLMILLTAILLAASNFAQTKMELGNQAMDSANYEAAVYYFTEYLQSEPKSCKAYVNRSIAYAYLHDYSASLTDANTAIKLWNKKSEIRISTPYLVRANAYEVMGDFLSALVDLNTAVKKDKNNYLCYLQRAQFYYSRELYDRAEADYRQAYKLNSSDTESAIEVARCLVQQDKEDDAIGILDRIIKYEPTQTEAIRLRAVIYYFNSDFKSFIDLYVQYLNLAPNGSLDLLLVAASAEYAQTLKAVSTQLKNATDKDMHFYWLGVRARVYQVKDQYHDALNDLRAMKDMISDSVTNVFIAYQSAICHENLYEYSEAAADYTELINVTVGEPFPTEAYLRRADCYDNIGKYEAAIDDYNKVIENDIDYAPMAYYGVGITYETLKDFDTALEKYNKGLLLDENNIALLMMRGRLLLLQKGDTIRANTDFKKILELDTVPESSVRHYALMYLGRYDEAIAWCNKILEEYPSAGNYYDAACLYSRMGKKQEAIKYLKDALELGYRAFVHMDTDSDLDTIRELQEYKDLVSKYKKEKIKSLFDKLP